MLKWIVGTLVGVVMGLAIYFGNYLGALRPVTMQEVSPQVMTLLSVDHVGAYHKISEDIVRVEDWAKAHKLLCKKTFGKFLDDPRVIEEGRLRSKAGCIWGESISEQVPLLPTELPSGFSVEKLEMTTALQAVFEGSPAIGPWKVYSKAEDYFAAKPVQRGNFVLEVYEVHSAKEMTTTYFFPFTTPSTR
jgi:hypothetical protein